MRLLAFFLTLFLLAGAAQAAPATALPAKTESSIHGDVMTAVGETNAITDALHEESGEHHEAAGPPQFAVHTFPSQLFWLVISFGALHLILTFAALPRIEQGISARAAHIHHLLNDARRLRDEAESHKNDMNQASDAAHHKAHEMLNKAAVEAQDVANRRNHELEAILQTKIKASEDRIATARANAVQSVREASQILLPVVLQKMADMKLSDKEISNLVNDIETPRSNGNFSRGAA
ncbi:MAG TPA: hypothetical protein PKW15_01985 [Alphaproteobacteria bacterium]|nr:hypothetical protein [Rhodospirillaceae bacterium]HRJ11993.1 hypothetical protein [Alphaproteobacteria bacterium]